MSALAVTLTRNSTVLLSAEPRPKLPLLVELRPGLRLSLDDKELLDTAAAGLGCGAGKLGRPCWDGRVLTAGAMMREGLLWICGALAAFCLAVLSAAAPD